MRLRIGYELAYECLQTTPMLLMLNTHVSRAKDVLVPDHINTDPWVPLQQYQDMFGNLCTRLIAPPGQMLLSARGTVEVVPHHEIPEPSGYQHAVEELPDECMMFLLGSRYCETDLLSGIAWQIFGETSLGRSRVQSICNFVHSHVRFDYNFARPTRTAWDTWKDGAGVCRDFAHLAIALCRAMNIPARYCTGYISDVGLPPPYAPMDFCAWFEAFLGNRWQTFDPRNNAPRTGRILIARGRDAADVAISNTFGPTVLSRFFVVCEPSAPTD